MAIDFEDLAQDDGLVAPSMNTTPLIDVLLVLLVMLIITIPIQLHSVQMDLPSGAPPADAPKPQVVRLELAVKQPLLWNGEAIASLAELDQRLQQAARERPQPEIHIHADAQSKYDTVAAILSAAQRRGLEKIGVVGLEEIVHPAGTGKP